MAKNKYSPAPWHETENDDGDVIVRMDENHSVVVTNLEGSCATCHANAHLIAAAPELLEALEIAIGNYHNYLHHGPIESCNNYSCKKACAAIAKARGES